MISGGNFSEQQRLVRTLSKAPYATKCLDLYGLRRKL